MTIENKITKQEVFDIADHIRLSQNVTIDRVRQALGNRGSNSTIVKYLKEWREKSSLTGRIEIVAPSDTDMRILIASAMSHQKNATDAAEMAITSALRAQQLLVDIMLKYLTTHHPKS